MPSRNFRELTVWQRGMDLVVAVYAFTKGFPKDEQFGLTSQIRRAAVSIPSNIAEGQSRNATRDFARFLHVSLGSLAELATQLEIAQRLGWLPDPAFQELEQLTREIGKMLNDLIRAIAKTDG